MPSNLDESASEKPTPRDVRSRETSADLLDENPGWHEARPYVWLALGTGIGALVLLTVLTGWLPLSAATGPGGSLHFPVLGALGLCVAAAVFGALRACARRRGEPFGRGLELGAPILGCALAIALGFTLQPKSAFDLTVFVQGENDPTERPLKSTGVVWLQLGDERREEAIDANGQVLFAQLPLRYRLEETTVGVSATGFETLSPISAIRIAGRPLTIVVRRAPKTLRGEVVDESGLPVSGASVYVLNGPTKQTDMLGRFEMVIPGNTAASEIDFAITAENFLVYRKRFLLGENSDPVTFTLKRVP